MTSRDQKEQELRELYGQLTPKAQDFIYRVMLGLVVKHTESPDLDNSLRFFTLTELEQMFSVTHRTLQEWVRTGYLSPVEKIGGKWRISEKDLLAFIKDKHIKRV